MSLGGARVGPRVVLPRPRSTKDLPLVAVLICASVLVGILAGVKPVYGLFAAVGLMFAAVTIVDLTVGFALFTVASFLDVLSASGSVSATKAIGLVVLGSWLALMATRRRNEVGAFFPENRSLAAWLLMLVVWSGLSATWAYSSSQALAGAESYAQVAMLIPIGYAAIRRPEHLSAIVAAFVFGAVISSGYGFFHPAAATSAASGRAVGLNGDPNAEAVLCAAAIPMMLGLVAVWPRARVKLTAVVAIVILLVGLVTTLSREGLIAFAAALAMGVLFGGRLRRVAAIAFTIGVVLVVGYYALLAPQTARNRITMSSTSGRSSVWLVATRVIDANPVLGVGVNNFILVSRQYIDRPGLVQASFIVDSPIVTHNTVLEALTDGGVVELLALVCTVGLAIRSAVRAVRIFQRLGIEPMEMLCRAIVLALTAILTSDMFVAGGIQKYLWVTLAMAAATYGVARRVEREALIGRPSRREARALTYAAPNAPTHALGVGRVSDPT